MHALIVVAELIALAIALGVCIVSLHELTSCEFCDRFDFEV